MYIHNSSSHTPDPPPSLLVSTVLFVRLSALLSLVWALWQFLLNKSLLKHHLALTNSIITLISRLNQVDILLTYNKHSRDFLFLIFLFLSLSSALQLFLQLFLPLFLLLPKLSPTITQLWSTIASVEYNCIRVLASISNSANEANTTSISSRYQSKIGDQEIISDSDFLQPKAESSEEWRKRSKD